MPDELSLQERLAPQSMCFGCGSMNPDGLHLQSHADAAGELTADWTPSARHDAFPGVLNGGVIGALLDCHSNWTAVIHLMRERGLDGPPGVVTADFHVKLRKPTPTDRPVHLRAWVVAAEGDRITVDSELSSDGTVTASCRATLVAVRPEHPAYHRW
ncbi:MAG: hypothetical protein QOH61_1122 [Chloroflexota bacterium]|jgi:acyl-coenzyme A thioesterase PaaI-like protein|nr:hypothetical protein [Chloroflexota bacterium]